MRISLLEWVVIFGVLILTMVIVGFCDGSPPPSDTVAAKYQQVMEDRRGQKLIEEMIENNKRIIAEIESLKAELKSRETTKEGPLTYEQARNKSLATGKPLVVWIGDAICPGCIQSTKEEFVHFFSQSYTGFPTEKGSLTVGMPVDGELLMAGQATEWPDGHLSTVRKIIRLWDAQPIGSRKTVTDRQMEWGKVKVKSKTVVRSQPVYSPAYVYTPPQMYSPMMMMGGFGRGSAVCST